MGKYRRKCHSAWGQHAGLFRSFCDSGSRRERLEYGTENEAQNAQKAVLNLMNRERIFDVSVRRRRNVIFLEKTGNGCADGRIDCRKQIMERFMRVE